MTLVVLSASTRLGLRRAALKVVRSHLPDDVRTQTQLAAILGITRARLLALRKSRVEQFSLDALVELAMRLGLNVRMTITRSYGRSE